MAGWLEPGEWAAGVEETGIYDDPYKKFVNDILSLTNQTDDVQVLDNLYYSGGAFYDSFQAVDKGVPLTQNEVMRRIDEAWADTQGGAGKPAVGGSDTYQDANGFWHEVTYDVDGNVIDDKVTSTKPDLSEFQPTLAKTDTYQDDNGFWHDVGYDAEGNILYDTLTSQTPDITEPTEPAEYTQYQQAQIELQTYIAENQTGIDQAYLALQQQQQAWEQEQAGVLTPYQTQQLQLAYDQLNAEQQNLDQQFQLAQQQQQYQQAYGQESLELEQQGLQFQQEQAAMQAEQERFQNLVQLAGQPISWLDYSMNANVTPLIQPFMMPLMPQDYQGLEGIQAGAPIPNWESIQPYLSQSQLYGAPSEFTPINPVDQLPPYQPIGSNYQPIQWNPPAELGGQGGGQGVTPEVSNWSPPPELLGGQGSGQGVSNYTPITAESPYSQYPVPSHMQGLTDEQYAQLMGPQLGQQTVGYNRLPPEEQPQMQGSGAYRSWLAGVTAFANAMGLEGAPTHIPSSQQTPEQTMGLVNWLSANPQIASDYETFYGLEPIARSSFRAEMYPQSMEGVNYTPVDWRQYSPQSMAQGGVVNEPTLAWLGEEGPEAVVPLSKNYVPSYWEDQYIKGGYMKKQSTTEEIRQRLAQMGVKSAYGNYATPRDVQPQQYLQQQQAQPTSQTAQSYLPLGGLPQLTRPSQQYLARMGPTALQQYYGYEQARTGATPEEQQWRLQQMAPPGGRYSGLSWIR